MNLSLFVCSVCVFVGLSVLLAKCLPAYVEAQYSHLFSSYRFESMKELSIFIAPFCVAAFICTSKACL